MDVPRGILSTMRFSLITCFYNSAARIREYLRAFDQLNLEGVELEVLWVDNASSDCTRTLLADAAAKRPGSIRVLFEPKPGLMHARCCAVAAATSEYLVFLDDDNEPDQDFFQELSRLVDRFPSALMFTGNARLPAEYEVPPEVAAALGLIAVRELSGEFLFTLDNFVVPHLPWGAGMVIRCSSMADTCKTWQAGDQLITGRSGSQLSSGEDFWIMHHATRNGGTLVFSERLRLIHRVDQSRLEPGYLTRLAFEMGRESPIHRAAVRRMKPQLPVAMPTPTQFLIELLLKLPLRTLRCWRSGKLSHLIGTSFRMGFVLGCLLEMRRTCSRFHSS